MILGLAVVYLTHLFDYKFFSRITQILFYISIPLLLLTLVLGTSLNSATRWLTLPGIGLSFQTSDLAKISLIMYVSRMLSLKQDTIKDFKGSFLPIIIPVGITCILILPANFSTALMLFLSCIVLMFIGRVSMKHLGLLGLSGILVFVLFLLIAPQVGMGGRIETWKNRFGSFVGAEEKENYQADQSKIAIVTGGILGKGPGNSTQRNFLPHPYSDFIYAIIIEEYGLIGGIIVLFLYLYLLFRAAIIVRRCDRSFPAFLAIGLTFALVFQALINMAVAVNIFPVTGQTLPLVSMGGSSMFFTGFALGVILSISKSFETKKAAVVAEENEENN